MDCEYVFLAFPNGPPLQTESDVEGMPEQFFC